MPLFAISSPLFKLYFLESFSPYVMLSWEISLNELSLGAKSGLPGDSAMEDWLIQPTINIMDWGLSPKQDNGLRIISQQEVVTSRCSIFQRHHRPMPQAHTALECWAHSLHNGKSCSPLCPQGLTQCLEHLTSIRKCFLSEWVMSEQITSSILTLMCDSQNWAKSWNLLFWRHGSEICYLVSEDRSRRKM